MQAAIYFQILDKADSSYEKPVLDQLKQLFPELILFDFDSQSDMLVVGYATKLLFKAEKAVIMIEASEGPTSGVMAFMEKIIANKSKCLVLLYGKNDLVERMLKLIDSHVFKYAQVDHTSVEKAIDFLSAR
jgi:hypothetical protein